MKATLTIHGQGATVITAANAKELSKKLAEHNIQLTEFEVGVIMPLCISSTEINGVRVRIEYIA